MFFILSEGGWKAVGRKAYSEQEREQVRTALLTTMIQCIVDRGLIHSSIDVLCRKVGISKTFFYTFFPSKEELVLEALRYQQPRLLQYARQLMDDPALGWREGVRTFLEICVYGKKKGIAVLSIEEENGLKVIRTKKNRYMAKAVILACGAAHRQLGIPGEEELSGMGVSYCATCDGAFFQDGTVAVVGGGNVAVEDAILLSRTCKKVYLVHRRDELRADKVLQDKLFKCANVEMVWDSVPTVIEGTDKVEDIKVHNVKTDEGKTIAVDGVFIAVGILPNTEKFKGLVDLDESGYIIAGEDGVTSTPGIFAAGDIRTKNLRQVVTAVADGANAVASVQRYLIEK